MTNQRSSKGFTIIELMVATAIFSLTLVILLTAFLRIGNMFYKGVSISNTQEVARTTIQDISDDIKFANDKPTVGANFFCIGQHRYKYNLGKQVGATGTPYGLEREDIPGGACSIGATGTSPQELLGSGMQLNSISIDSCPNDLCTIKLLVVYYGSDNGVFTSPSGFSPAYKATDATCQGNNVGTQFCATAKYETRVSRKI